MRYVGAQPSPIMAVGEGDRVAKQREGGELT
jgi:hypothetical protein